MLDKFYKISWAYSFILWLEQKQLVHSLFSSWKLHKLCYEISREPLQAHLTTQSSSFIRDAQSAETSTETSRRPSSAANNADKTITAAAVVALVWIARRRSALLCFNKLGSVQCVWLCCALFCLHAVNSWTFLCGARPADSAAQQPRLIAVDSLLTSLLLSWKKDYVCSWLFSFYLYFKPHTRCRVGLELVTGARGCIIHEEEPLAAAAK